jgi:hypothetical protein
VELQKLRGKAKPSDITDEDVINDYLGDVSPHGRTFQYLRNSKLMHIQDNTLIVHGAVLDDNFGKVPDRPGVIFEDPRVWAKELNRWYQSQLDLYESTGKCQPLIDYHRPIPGTFANRESVMIARYTDSQSRSKMPSDALIAHLKKHGISRIIVGHTPQGDGPTVLRSKGFEIIIGDNTDARHASRVFVKGEESIVQSKAPRVDGGTPEKYEMRWNINDGGPFGKRVASTGDLIKGRFADGDWLTFKVDLAPYFTPHHGSISDKQLQAVGYVENIGTHEHTLRFCAGAFN